MRGRGPLSGQGPRPLTSLAPGADFLLPQWVPPERQVYLIQFAAAPAQPDPQRDLEAAADRGLAAVHLVESVISTLGIDRLRNLYLQMQPHASISVVVDFLEEAREILTT